MLERTPGAVGCGHCQRTGIAVVNCPICGRLVCESCASPAACSAPIARSIRLGRGWRLRAVDERGKWGIVTSWTGGRRRVVDLTTGRSFNLQFPLSGFFACLGPDNQLVCAGQDTLGGQPGAVELSISDTQQADPVRLVVAENAWIHNLALSEDGRFVAVAAYADERNVATHVVDLTTQRKHSVSNQPGHAQAIAMSSQLDMLALGFWGHIRFYRLRTGSYISRMKVGLGDVAWLSFAENAVAAISESGVCRLVSVDNPAKPNQWATLYRTNLKMYRPFTLAHRDLPTRRRVRAALSPDLQLLAVREKKKALTVIRLADDHRQNLRGHTDRINLLRFVSGGRALISADLDNRVIRWPRTEEDLIAETIASHEESF